MMIIAAIALGAVAIAVAFALPKSTYSAGASSALTGYLWSDTIGWIDLNCSNTSSCASNPFGIALSSSGTLSGYAWSDSVGWVSANASDVSACGTQATLSGSSFTGWLRVLSGGTAQSGGWDGCISLSGSGYGVTESVNGALSGYAWGDTNVGWLDFSGASLAASCVPINECVGNTYSSQNQFCQVTPIKACTGTCTPAGCSEDLPPPTGAITAQPTLVRSGGTTQISWSSTNATACTVTSDSNSDSWSGLASPAGGDTSSAIGGTVIYTLSCTGNGGAMQQPATVKVYIAPKYHEF